jgi:hypothetical protein
MRCYLQLARFPLKRFAFRAERERFFGLKDLGLLLPTCGLFPSHESPPLLIVLLIVRGGNQPQIRPVPRLGSERKMLVGNYLQ